MTILSVLLLLALYTLFAARRVDWGADRQADAGRSLHDARALASTVEAEAAALRAALTAAAALHEPGAPLDAADSARRAARPAAAAVAVVGINGVRAVSGQAEGADWREPARRARSAETEFWVGRAGDDGHVFAAVKAPDAVMVARWPAARLLSSAGDQSLAVVDRTGAVLAGGGAFRADGAASLDVFGVSAETLRRAGDRGRVFDAQLPDGRKGQGAAAEVLDGSLYVVALGPKAASGRAGALRLADDLAALLAPLAIGLALTLLMTAQARRAERARRAWAASEERFRLAVEAARCGIWEWDLERDTVFMSDVTGVMLGWGGGGLAPGSEVLQRIAPEHRGMVRSALQTAAAHGAVDVSFCVPKEAGAAWIDARGQAVGAPGAKGYPRIIGVAVDVSDERTAQARAQAAETRLRDAIDSVSEAFVLWDRQGRLLTCNANYRDFFSIEPRLLKPGASYRTVQSVARAAIKRETSPADGRKGVREAELTSGRWIQISERRTAEGGLVMTAADITAVKLQEEARRRNEEALQALVRRLEESQRELAEVARKYAEEKVRAEGASKAKTEFLANMSHELRTPLNAINGFSEIMCKELFGPLGDKRYAEYARDILDSGQHLLALINDILDMSKIEAGKLNLRYDVVDVEEVVRDAVRLMRNRAEAGELSLTCDIAGDLPELEADYRALKQVLLNLLSNAVKFTPKGGRVAVRAERAGDRLRLSVEDTGVGISPDDLHRLARPFEQAESQLAKTQQGTGLGLALTKSLVEMHHGVLDLASRPGAGTTVTVEMPLRRPRRHGEKIESELDAA